MTSVKTELIKTRDNLREKFKNLKRLQQQDDAQIQSFFNPVVKPLRELINIQKSAKPTTTTTQPSIAQQQVPFFHSSPIVKKQLGDISMSDIKDQTDESFTTVVAGDDSREADVEVEKDNPQIFFETPEQSTILRRTDTTLFKEKLGHTAGDYMKLFNRPDLERIRDQTYGIRYEESEGRFKIGNKKVDIDKNDIKVGEEWFEGTPGLYELLIKKTPDLSMVSEQDKKNYKTILLKTSVHKRGYVDHNPVKSNSGFKYMKIIKPLLHLKDIPRTSIRSPLASTSDTKLGKGGFQFYSNPNELVKRLKLLHASSMAGNNSHHNEIVDILTELKRIGCISIKEVSFV